MKLKHGHGYKDTTKLKNVGDKTIYIYVYIYV